MIKKTIIQNINHSRHIEREIEVLSKFKGHKNVVNFFGKIEDDKEIYIVEEFCEGGSLFSILHQRSHIKLNWNQKLKFLREIVDGMNALHQNENAIIHRDLKSLK